MNIRKINNSDYKEYMAMVSEFFSSDAVMHELPTDFFKKSFEYFTSDSNLGDCFFIEDNKNVVGYAVTAYTWSQEGGGKVCWIEELFIKKEFRAKGYGKSLFSYIIENCPSARFRLEVEPENVNAVKLYKSFGFEFIPYREMIKEIEFKK